MPLVDPDADDGDVEEVPVDVPIDARLGRFHPAAAEMISGVLERRAIPYTVLPHDDEVEVLVARSWRDDLRTELAVSWNDLVRGLDEPAASEVRASGGDAPGWFDAPRGGYVDRAGRMVVEVADDDEDADAARVVGPVLLTAGAVAVVVGWYLLSSPAVIVAGIALAIVGLLIPR